MTTRHTKILAVATVVVGGLGPAPLRPALNPLTMWPTLATV